MGTKRMSGELRREQLIGVSRTLFAERGYTASTMEEIAARAGVTKPVVYEHFGTKENLYKEVVTRDADELLAIMLTAIGSATGKKRVENMVRAAMKYVEDHSESFVILVRGKNLGPVLGTPMPDRSYQMVINDVTAKTVGLIDEALNSRGIVTAEAEIYAQCIVGVVTFVAQWHMGRAHPTNEVVVDHLVNFMWNGLSALESLPGEIG